MKKRLSLTIFLAVLGSLAVFAVAVSAAWWWNAQARDVAFEERLAGELAAEILPLAADGPDQLRRALERWHRRARIDLTVLDEEGRVVASAGRRLVDEGAGGHRHRGSRRIEGSQRGRLWTFDVGMPDGRWLLARPQRIHPGPRPVSPMLALGLLMLAGALVAWPVSRRITQRLERLQAGVDQQGAGNLAARIAVEGSDEVAALARSFNQSAARIQDLVDRQEGLLSSQKRLLANASHELRSPLARIRMAIELLLTRPQEHEQLAAELRQNVAELDQLVDEILLASRLETTVPALDEVDIAGLAAEEASRVGADVAMVGRSNGDDPQSMLLRGDPRLLRRMLRNLLENAGRHGASEREPVRIDLSRLGRHGGEGGDGVLVAVLDRGPGVPEGAREKIFEPFYRIEGHSEQAGGVGLGLALVRQIAEAHGGSAGCEPREGGGSRFVIWLPVEPKAAARAQAA